MITFKRIAVEDMPWDRITKFNGASIFHTLPWINFIADVKKAEPVIATVQSDDQIQGYFMGFITKKYGLKILGSPLRGWGTYYMGFILLPGVRYYEVLQAFPKFAFDKLKCHYLEIIDPNLGRDDCNGLSYRVEDLNVFTLDLTKSEQDLFARMHNTSCRYCIRKAIKKGVVIEETTDPGFAAEYYAQFRELLMNKKSDPPYGLEYVQQLVAHILPTGYLLLLRARNPEGICIATLICLVFNNVAIAWGEASWQQYRTFNPNELIYWYAMKRLKAMGGEVLNLGRGVRYFKKKLGCYETQAFRLMKVKNPLLNILLYVFTSIKDNRIRILIRRVMVK